MYNGRYNRYADYLVQKKYLEAEMSMFESSRQLCWSKFKLKEETKGSVRKHLAVQMNGYTGAITNTILY